MSPLPHVVLQPGVLFHGRYRVARLLKAGGMGAVHEVEDRNTDRRCALKVMLPGTIDNPDLRARFAQEAKPRDDRRRAPSARPPPAGGDAPEDAGDPERRPAPPRELADVGRAALVVVEPEHILRLGTRYELSRDKMRVGRAADSDIVIDDPAIADMQALLERLSDGWVLRNCAREVHTYRNRAPVSAPVPLEYGDQVSIGRTQLAFVAGNRLYIDCPPTRAVCLPSVCRLYDAGR